MHYYQFNIGDYIKHTIHLSPIEDIAYRRLLDMYYDTESEIPNNIPLVSRRLRIDEKTVESVLNEFFVLTENGYKNYRADAEIAAYHAYLAKQRDNGKLGGRPKKTQRKPTANPSQTQTEPKKSLNINHKPLTIKQNNKDIKAPEGVSPEVWDAFVAQRKLSRAAITETVIKSIQREADKAGWTLEQALSECAARGWRGFKAEWVADKSLGQPVKESAWARKQREDQERMDEFRGKRSNIIDIPSQEIIFSEFKELSK